jgi:hypothetical protein
MQNPEQRKDKQFFYDEMTQKGRPELEIEKPEIGENDPEPESLNPIEQKLSEIVSLRKRVIAKRSSEKNIDGFGIWFWHRAECILIVVGSTPAPTYNSLCRNRKI